MPPKSKRVDALHLNYNPMLRLAGVDRPMALLIQHHIDQSTAQGTRVHFIASPLPTAPEEDPTMLDPTLQIDPGGQEYATGQLGDGYAGLTPRQRFEFLIWSVTPLQPAPQPYLRLFVANLEARLFDEVEFQQQAILTLLELFNAPAWREHELITRAILLAFWLRQAGAPLAEWLAQNPLPSNLLGIALGVQAGLKQPLRVEQLATIATVWRLPVAGFPIELLKLRLNSLASNLQGDPLAYALAQLPDAARTPRPWRAAHRQLRIALPQPDLRSTLEPLLRDMLSVSDGARREEVAIPHIPDNASLDDLGWRLILEFGESRSEFFDHVLRHCQRLPGYVQIMDENRRMVHRVLFRKSEMRRFWQLWDYVQNWSTSRVYVNGVEVEKWKIWPYSQYLR
jgi:hypothetical protein